MKRILVPAISTLLLLGPLAACSEEKPDAGSPATTTTPQGFDGAAEESSATDASDPAASGDGAESMPDGARPGSADFPFPVPQDWPEQNTFHEDKIGKDISWSGSFVYPGDSQAAAATYRQLLEGAGFIIHPNPLGEVVNEASFIAEGKVNGVAYTGPLDFDVQLGGDQVVSINLTKD